MVREILAPSQLRSWLRGSRQQIVEYQNARLRRLIEHAYQNVPYYRRLLDQAGIKAAAR